MTVATFRKRSPYQWQAQVRKKGQPLQTKTFETCALAEQWARAIEVEMDKGVFVSRAEAESTTLKELLERYLGEITPLKKGAASETNRLKALMRLPLAQRFVAGIRGVDIARFRDERLQKVTPSTVKRDLVLLGHAFEVARKEWGIHFHNPVRDIKLPSENRPRDRCLQAGEETRLLAACKQARNPWLLPIVQLALETAMRQGELIRLRWEHIDLNRRTAHLPDTKNGESRTVPLSTTAIRVLRALPRSLQEQHIPGQVMAEHHALPVIDGIHLGMPTTQRAILFQWCRGYFWQFIGKFLRTVNNHIKKLAERLAANFRQKTDNPAIHRAQAPQPAARPGGFLENVHYSLLTT